MKSFGFSFIISRVSILILYLASFFFSMAQQGDKVAGKKLDSFVKAKMKELSIPGMAIGVVHDGRVVKMSVYGFANLEWKEPVGIHTNFQIASCSKLLTSTLVMKAIQDKKLRLDDPVEKYVDSIPAAWKGLQVKHLLNHSSGIRNYNGDKWLSTSQVIRSLEDSTLEYSYGTAQHYANYDYALLGYILERIYHKPYGQILKQEVTGPLMMNDGGYDYEQMAGSIMRSRLISQRATTYYGPAGEKLSYKFLYAPATYTAGGYFASIDDMTRWAVALDRESLFSSALLDHHVYGCDSIGNNLSAYSRAGWIVEKEGNTVYAGHSGGPGLADILRFPDQGYTFIVLTNDGEILPYFARSLACFYIGGLKQGPAITKFRRE